MCSLKFTFSNWGSGRPYAINKPHGGTKDNACVVFDGQDVIFASEAERWSHHRHDREKPRIALEKFKQKAKISDDDLEKIVVDATEHIHHENHIYECFYQSGFKNSAVFINDGRGETECVTLAYIEEGKKPITFKKFPYEQSICGLYHKASRIIHKTPFGEGKMMGLSAYGSNNGRKYMHFDEQTKTLFSDKELLKNDLRAFLGDEHLQGKDVMLAKDVAFTVQKNFEDVVVGLIKYLKEILEEKGIQTDNLCLSGGGILNCPANSRIVDLGYFKHYYASPQPSDGCAESIGASFKEMQKRGISLRSKRLESAYLGLHYVAEDVEGPRECLIEPYLTISKELASSAVIAWFQGCAEYGPRALGHRSFLADPSQRSMLESLNKIKGRENWRPLAPIVPEELFTKIFDVENTDMCEFMLRTLTIKEKWRPRLQAVCHVDGTTRPQLLKRKVNPQLYDLLMTWFDRTHVPCLVNTSLNINGFPIVETPYDLRCLQEEILYLNDVPNIVSIFVDENQFYDVSATRRNFPMIAVN